MVFTELQATGTVLALNLARPFLPKGWIGLAIDPNAYKGTNGTGSYSV